MDKLFSSTKKIIFTKQKDILSSALILAVMIVVSRFFGFIRFRTLATYFSKEELDLFFAAFRIPDFVFEILISGALTSAFIPLFIKYEKDKDELNRKVSSIINFIMVGLFIFVILAFIFADKFVPFLTPGFSKDKIDTIIILSRILLLSQLPFLVLGNILSGIAQANKTFIITAIAPILYNLGIILGTILFVNSLWIYAPIVGVIIGGFLFFIVQVPVAFVIGFKYRFFSFDKKTFKEFFTLFLPRVLTILTTQIDLTIDLILSSLLGAGSYTIFFFGQHLSLFPVSFIGMAFGQASLPYLSDLYKENKFQEIKKIFVNSLLQLLYIIVPISLFFIFARTPIVRLFYGGEKFDWEGTVLTALTLSYFAITIPLHTIFYFINRAFYATYDTKTPFLVNFFSVFINVIFSLLFVFVFKAPIWSLAISFSISITINVILLIAFFYRKIGGFDIVKLLLNTTKIYLISFISAFISYGLMKILDKLVLDTTRTINIAILLSSVGFFFLAIYLFLSWLLNVEEVYVLSQLMVKMGEMKRKISETFTDTG
jgi:putative peptidoglycan lipid II flippase